MARTPTVNWNEKKQRWMAWVTFPDGSRRKVERVDKANAKNDLNELLALRASDGAAPGPRHERLTTFDGIIEDWLDAGCPVTTAHGSRRRHAATKSENTVSHARTTLRPNVTRPTEIHPKANRKYPTTNRKKVGIGKLWVDRTTTERVEQVFEAMDADGLASSTIYHTWLSLNHALAWGVRKGRHQTNPAADCLLPEVKPTNARKSLTLEDAKALFAILPTERLAPLWTTALMVGSRPGEIRGVRWPFLDIDSEEPHMAIDERAHEVEKKYVGQRSPKADSNRTVGLHPFNVAVLLRHREELKLLNLYDPEGFVFPTRSGTPHSQSSTRKYFQRLCGRAELGTDWTTYDLRHSFASIADEMLKGDGDRKRIGKVMGHTNESTTAGYIHSVHNVRPVLGHAIEVWDQMLKQDSEQAS